MKFVIPSPSLFTRMLYQSSGYGITLLCPLILSSPPGQLCAWRKLHCAPYINVSKTPSLPSRVVSVSPASNIMVLTNLSDSMNAEAMERIFNAAGGAVKEHRLASWSNRMDRLLGVAGNPNFILSEMPDANELNEEDVWGEDLQDMASFSLQESLLDAFRPLTSSRRTVATEKDLGLSTALGGEIGKGREIYPLLLLNESDETRPASRLSSSSRMISRRESGGYSRMYMIPHSAPVNVPGWSKMSDTTEMRAGDDDNVGDSDDDAERLPPHEFFARRADISSFSVLEGAGRTLKGRDLSRVRSAVYRQTGFDE